MKKILVTGGAGFIGSHLCKILLDQGNHVLCVDNYFTGRKENISQLIDNPFFEIIRQDVCLPLYVEVDEIYNLACPASPYYYQKDPIQTMKTSILGSYNLLGLAKRTGAKILQASTSEVYGDPQIHPQIEEYWGNVNPIGIRACYDEGKRAAETLFMDYYRIHKVDVRIIRIFNTYGPKMAINDGRVVSNFIVQALQNKDITIYGSGEQTRSFCYVDDLLNGMLKYMSYEMKETFPGPINFGNPVEFTMNELALLIIKLSNSTSKIIYKPLPEDDPQQRRPNIDKAKSLLNWEPKIDINQGLSNTIEYFTKKLYNKV